MEDQVVERNLVLYPDNSGYKLSYEYRGARVVIVEFRDLAALQGFIDNLQQGHDYLAAQGVPLMILRAFEE
jgi:hypothetical protein